MLSIVADNSQCCNEENNSYFSSNILKQQMAFQNLDVFKQTVQQERFPLGLTHQNFWK